ncbi:DMT family transporter [Kiloniella laminariae]|uniref:DMT family transporter n=1 Tax=Kiloniella laminariae TaxID=454162 RepID=A0ABT4LDK1_9PROT|nr:DMT family transporter [Kiloniella laminariae]MCZ4279170.1 DMT family transporter [Kiloniella laminariae]
MSAPRRAFMFLVIAQLLWAGNFIVGRAFAADIAPLTLSFWRWTVAFACLLPFAGPALVREWPLYRPVIWKMILLALLSVTSFNTLLYFGLQTTGATNAALLNSMIPVIIITLSFLCYGERIRLIQIVGIMVSFCGVLVLITRGNFENLLGLTLNSGDFLVLGAVVSWAFYSLWLRWKPEGVSLFSFVLLSIGIGDSFLGVIYFSGVLEAAPLELSLNNILAVFYASVPVSILAFTSWNIGVRQVGASLAGQFIHLLPVFASAMAIILLGEKPELYHGAGAILIGLGVWFSVRKKRRAIKVEPV